MLLAVELLDSTLALAVVDRIAAVDADLAVALREMVNALRYGELLAVLES
jgi:hypothetical protein